MKLGTQPQIWQNPSTADYNPSKKIKQVPITGRRESSTPVFYGRAAEPDKRRKMDVSGAGTWSCEGGKI